MTQDVFNARAYTVQDAGNTDGYRMHFSVLYGDVVVEASSKGVAPDWVFEQLVSIAD